MENVIQHNENMLTSTITEIQEALNQQINLGNYLLTATNMLEDLEIDMKEILELSLNSNNKLSQFEFISIEQIVECDRRPIPRILRQTPNQSPRSKVSNPRSGEEASVWRRNAKPTRKTDAISDMLYKALHLHTDHYSTGCLSV